MARKRTFKDVSLGGESAHTVGQAEEHEDKLEADRRRKGELDEVITGLYPKVRQRDRIAPGSSSEKE